MVGMTAAALIDEIDIFGLASDGVYRASKIDRHCILTSREVFEVIEVGKALASFHRYATTDFHRKPIGSVQHLVNWFKESHPQRNIDSDMLELFAELAVDCFAVPVSSERLHRKQPAKTENGYAAYLSALRMEIDTSVFDAFMNKSWLPNPTNWPAQYIGKFGSGLRTRRLEFAADYFRKLVRSHSGESPLYNDYLDCAALLPDVVDSPDVHREEFRLVAGKLRRHLQWLENCPRDFIVDLDERGALHVIGNSNGGDAASSAVYEVPATPPQMVDGMQPQGSLSGNTEDDPPSERLQRLAPLTKALREAINAYERAERSLEEVHKKVTSRSAYEWICEHDDEYTPASFDAFSKSVGRAKLILGEKKNFPRGGRESRSAVKRKDD